LKHLLKSK
jgi:hypothetical protein